MSREDQIGSFRDEEGKTRWQLERAATERPAAEIAGDTGRRIIIRRISGTARTQQTRKRAATAARRTRHAAAHAAREARQRIFSVPLTCTASRIEEEQTVMHDAASRWPELRSRAPCLDRGSTARRSCDRHPDREPALRTPHSSRPSESGGPGLQPSVNFRSAGKREGSPSSAPSAIHF